ncbi:MAG TPA: class I SAM-dependent methyltransferase [Polyangia bacterium]|nr:class I SAM-dependent methyltransferase [Polyangia bacterium]
MVCRSCGSQTIEPILSLGETPLANSYPRPQDLAVGEPRFPLDLVRCTTCALVQITEVVPPEVLFRDYLYLSSYSTTMLEHARVLVERLVGERKLGPQSLAVEVASNDGYLLQYYLKAGVPVLGIEPARNVAEIAERERGVRTVAEFFDTKLATELRASGTTADVIHANNVLAHVADLNGFVQGFRVLLGDEGVVVSESPYLRPFLERVEFDTIYHEHLYYYSLTALDRLFRRHQLVIEDCEHLPIHGGSLRIFARRQEVAVVRDSVKSLLADEAAWGVDRSEPYARFAGQVERVKSDVVKLVRELRAAGHEVAAYGAAAKGSTLLNTTGLTEKDLAFVCDRNPLKQGRLMPGAHIPIVAPEELATRNPPYCLILAWNLADEIVRIHADYRARGGKFIIPVPTVKVI